MAEEMARRTAEVVGDYCIVRMQREGRLEGVAFAHTSAEAEPLIRRLTEHPDVVGAVPLYAEIVRDPRTIVDNEVVEGIFAHIHTADIPATFEQFRARRGMICPLVSHGRLLGTITLGRAAGPAYTPNDVRLVEAIASRATLALDNAALFSAAQREADEARIARGQAEEAGRVKDEFLATLSHELRTPLNAILGWAHMLRDTQLPPERRQAAIDTIVRNAQSQEQLISDILDVQRIMAGKIRLSLRRVDLGAIIRSAAETVQPSAAAKQVRLQLLVELDVPAVNGDPDRLQQIVWNLLTNAIKFAPQGGRVQVELLRDDASCEVIVRDNGPGISAEFMPHMFERFRQADSSTTRTHKGLGLGLAIVRSLVEMHGGSIAAENVSGEETGAIFRIRLPIHAVTASSMEIDEPGAVSRADAWISDAPALGDVRVLVVEDDLDARELIGAILARCGARVTLTASAEDGYAAALAERPDVIISDIEMPHEDGYAFIRRVRALGPDRGGDVPAAALTAYASPADRMKALGAGFNIHLAKPVQPAELATVVASLTGRLAEGRASASGANG
jgi:signal transduction histidine kinase/CheY-like chemotaxis protein